MTQKLPVLVTGGAGYIGSHAVLALLDAGWPVCVIDNLVTGFRWAVPEGVPFYEGDIEDEALLARIFAEQGVRAVMHFAGSVVVPESVSDPLKYYHNNTAKTRALIAAAVKSGVPHFIFSSTAATYGVPEVSPVTETTPQRPINPYGMSKLMTEFMLRDTAAAHPINFCALRYFNVAGADPQARTGQSTAGATHLIKVAVEAALGKRAQVDVFGTDFDTPDGTGVRDYIHVSDLADAHVLALEQLIILKLAQMPLRVSTSHLAALLVDAQGRAARSDYAGCHALNVEFHETLAGLTGNAALLDTYQRLVSELSLFRQQAHASSRNALSLQRSVADHRAIYEALVAGDGALAWSVLHPHVEASRQRLQSLLNDEPERLT